LKSFISILATMKMKKVESGFFLGADGGATKTTVIVTDAAGNIVSLAEGPGTNRETLESKEFWHDLVKIASQAARACRGKIRYACFGLAGVDTKEDRDAARQWIGKCGMEKALGCPVAVVNDIEIVLPCINASSGIAAIAGTGSSYYGVKDGKTAKAGGLGAALSDEGSAYDVAVNVLRAAVRSWDGRGEKTLLENMVFSRTDANDGPGLKDAIRKNPGKAGIAAFAKLAHEAEQKGDAAAKRILDDAAREHVTGIAAIIKKLDFSGSFEIALTGRLFSKNVLTARVREALDKTAPRAKVRVVKEPAIGAAKLAMELYKQSRKKP